MTVHEETNIRLEGLQLYINIDFSKDDEALELYNSKQNIDNLNKTKDFREKMASYIAYEKTNGKNKSDSWYDKTERTLLNKSYQDLYKQYKKLGGKQNKSIINKNIKK